MMTAANAHIITSFATSYRLVSKYATVVRFDKSYPLQLLVRQADTILNPHFVAYTAFLA